MVTAIVEAGKRRWVRSLVANEADPNRTPSEGSRRAIDRSVMLQIERYPAHEKRPDQSVGAFLEWTGGDLNPRHLDFQSSALPTELPVRVTCGGTSAPRAAHENSNCRDILQANRGASSKTLENHGAKRTPGVVAACVILRSPPRASVETASVSQFAPD